MPDLFEAAAVAQQAAQLWKHIPRDEVPDDDEPIGYKIDPKGCLVVTIPRKGCWYSLRHKAGWRMRPLEGDLWECSIWQWRELVKKQTVHLSEALSEHNQGGRNRSSKPK